MGKVTQRWGSILGHEIKPLTLPDLRGSMGIKVLCDLHCREERDMAGGMGAESTECSFLEALGITSRGRGCCSKREAGRRPRWQVWARTVLWAAVAVTRHRPGISDHSCSVHRPSADSSRAGTTVSLRLWCPSAQHSLALSKCSGRICWTNEGQSGLTMETAMQFRADRSPKGVSPSILIS